MTNTPKYHRPFKDNRIGWEIYSWKTFFINISLGMFEIQFNRWGNKRNV